MRTNHGYISTQLNASSTSIYDIGAAFWRSQHSPLKWALQSQPEVSELAKAGSAPFRAISHETTHRPPEPFSSQGPVSRTIHRPRTPHRPARPFRDWRIVGARLRQGYNRACPLRSPGCRRAYTGPDWSCGRASEAINFERDRPRTPRAPPAGRIGTHGDPKCPKP
jgi:hypothetical protein